MGKRLEEANAFQRITIIAVIFILYIGIYSAEGEYIMSRLGYDARSTGMGETGYLYNNSVSVMKVNPAGLGMIEGNEVTWTRTDFGDGAWHDCVNTGVNFNENDFKIGIGMNWNRLWVRGLGYVPDTTLDPQLIALQVNREWPVWYSIDELCMGIGIFKEFISIGGELKVSKGIIPRSSGISFTAITGDVGIIIKKGISSKYLNGISFTAVAHEVGGGTVKWSDNKIQKSEMVFDIGFGLKTNNISFENVIEYNHKYYPKIIYKTGAELNLNKWLSIRAGYNGNGITVGSGINLQKFRIDFGFAVNAIHYSIGKIEAGWIF